MPQSNIIQGKIRTCMGFLVHGENALTVSYTAPSISYVSNLHTPGSSLYRTADLRLHPLQPHASDLPDSIHFSFCSPIASVSAAQPLSGKHFLLS